MPAIFKTVGWEVQQLVDGVQQGSISLPDLQRPFVWPASKVRDLFDSMYLGYPAGTLMFWDVSQDGATRSISGRTDVGATYQIVDGQQRLTSLYAAMKGLTVQDSNFRSKKITISFNPFTEKFEVRTPALAKSADWIEDIAEFFASPFRTRRQFINRLNSTGRDVSEEMEMHIEEVLSRLDGIRNYQFSVVHIESTVEKEQVADIFVRINSEGVQLKAYDYILTWLSVFWPEGRDQIEKFARNSRLTPERATEVEGTKIDWTPINPYIAVEPGHLVRVLVAIGQNRAKLTDAYSNLQAKDRTTGYVSAEKQERELEKLRQALPVVTNPVNWTEFIHSIRVAGFRSHAGITSNMNLIASYVIFLIGRTRFNVELEQLRNLTARWIFMAQLTGRYTGSGESQIQRDIDDIAQLDERVPEAFGAYIETTIKINLTNDFWQFNLPQMLVTSSYKLSPAYQCYLAALNCLDADMFMLHMKVRDWMDPTAPAVKGLEGHHLFPRGYQEQTLGITDNKRINQAANFAPTDWNTNIAISNRPPSAYWPELVQSRGADSTWLDKQHYWHALPPNWASLEYSDFLDQRRSLIAAVTRDGFNSIGKDASFSSAAGLGALTHPQQTEKSLSELFDDGFLLPGDLLDPLDPDWSVDAVVTDDGTIQIDGVHEFDSLDAAAQHLGVTNLSGFEFWALEKDGGFASLAEVVDDGPRNPVSMGSE